MLDIFASLILYAAGLALTLRYAFTTHFLEACDTPREFILYRSYMAKGLRPTLEQFRELYPLQVTSLFTTWLPAIVGRWLTISMGWYKFYLAIFPPLIPVIAYLLCREWFDAPLSILGAVLVMAQPGFLQSPSMGRTNFGVLLFGVVLLSVYCLPWPWSLVALVPALLLPFAHYAVAGITAVVLFGAGVLTGQPVWIAVSLAVGLSGLVWCKVASPDNGPLWQVLGFLRGALRRKAVVLRSPTDRRPSPPLSWRSLADRGKLIEAALGRTPHKALLVWAWVVLGMVVLGICEKPTVIAILFAAGLALVICIPYLAQAYGPERLYYQASIVFAPALGAALTAVGTIWGVAPWLLGVALLMPFLLLMERHGVIPSLKGAEA